QDITERKRAEKALQESEELYRVLAEKSFAGVYVIQDGKFRFLNSNAASYAGYTPEELIGRDSMKLVHPEDRNQLKKNAVDMLYGKRTFPYEYRIITREGQIKWLMEMSASISWEGKRAVLGNSMDITDRKRTEEEISFISVTDQLTGLYNRRGFITLAEQQLKLSHRNKRDILLFFADLDGMKAINDTLGHEEGDRALQDVALILRETFRASDIVARIGGDEFAILAIDTTGIYPDVMMTRLQNQIDTHNRVSGRRYTISISMGAAYYDPEKPCSLDELMSRADALMYEQKRRKKT
ncbi:MAG: diguanylate cyclase, partial [Syntrophaceae bacterium]|nr:diguanylate cyclase [Syntrophaceae bacterium]